VTSSRRGTPIIRNATIAIVATGVVLLALMTAAGWIVNRWRTRHETPAP
jgi:hypothetical protein